VPLKSAKVVLGLIARKDLERRSGIRAHKNEFWWGIGKKGTAQSVNNLISQYNAISVLFSAIKKRTAKERLVIRRIRMAEVSHAR
jgi:hypothetical protein